VPIGPDDYYGSSDWEAMWSPPPRHVPPGSVDDQRICALLDGRLDGVEREAALMDLAASEADGSVFHDTAAVLREAEEAEAAEAGRIART
jgi:hypothetical protein